MIIHRFPAARPRGRVDRSKNAVLLTCYMTGATEGNNLGTAGYSYDFVAQLFHPLLEHWGEVIPVPDPRRNLDRAAHAARRRGLKPIHVSFLPFQDAPLAESAPNVIVPAWEFPDVPDHAFGGNPHNNWPAVANRCEGVIVGGPFTQEALQRSGTTAPIHIVPVPTPDAYFSLPAWDPDRHVSLDCRPIVFPRASRARSGPVLAPTPTVRPLKRLGVALETAVRRPCKRILGERMYRGLTGRGRAMIHGRVPRNKRAPKPLVSPYVTEPRLDLSGIVYTSIFNPADGRKNWLDLLTGFLYALGDCEDATLVLKLITNNPKAIERLVRYYLNRNVPHRCKVVLLPDFLSEDQMLQLAEASTYYLQTTKAEGNCLPLMNYLAAQRPGVSPCHSAIADYFDERIGFVLDSNPEPAAWPHDPRLRLRTTWARLVWPSVRDQIRRSYELAKCQRALYREMGARGRAKLRAWASESRVEERLLAALDACAGRAQAGEAAGPPRLVRRAA